MFDEECSKFEKTVGLDRNTNREHLNIKVKDVAEWHCPKSSLQDWENTPEVLVKVVGYLMAYNRAVAAQFYI